MAGTHQIWSLDMRQNLCRFYSGSGSEGNENSDPRSSTWAQPSGITAGTFNGEAHIFIADSESSSIRAINQDTENACNVAGANQDSKDLFDFGDIDGKGHSAKLQHPLGIHYSEANQTLYVADTYNHKIKRMRNRSGLSLTAEQKIETWLGDSDDKSPRVLDAPTIDARLNEPNGCWARTSKDKQARFLGLYIADTGNNCIRFAHADGRVETLELVGIPEVRSTAHDSCSNGVCRLDTPAAKQAQA